MNKKTITIIIIVATLILLAALFIRSQQTDTNIFGGEVSEEKKAEIAKKEQNEAARFILKNFKGEEVSSNDFDGKVLVLNSWATWCPFCVNELPDFAELQKAYPDEIAVIAVNRNEPSQTAKAFVDELGITNDLTFLVDSNDSFYKSIGGFAMPTTLFINTEGDIVVNRAGPIKIDEMKEIVDNILTTQ